MKPLIKNLLFVCVFFPLFAYAQPDSTKVVIRFNAGYTTQQEGVQSLYLTNASSIVNWNTGISVGGIVSKYWEIGAGFTYQQQHMKTNYSAYMPSLGAVVMYTDTKIHLVTANLYAAYRLCIFHRLYFNPVFSLNVGQASGKQHGQIISARSIPSDQFTFYDLSTDGFIPDMFYEADIASYSYFALNAAPACSFYFNRHIAATLVFGSFQFSMVDGEWDNRQWTASVSPAYWQLGLALAF